MDVDDGDTVVGLHFEAVLIGPWRRLRPWRRSCQGRRRPRTRHPRRLRRTTPSGTASGTDVALHEAKTAGRGAGRAVRPRRRAGSACGSDPRLEDAGPSVKQRRWDRQTATCVRLWRRWRISGRGNLAPPDRRQGRSQWQLLGRRSQCSRRRQGASTRASELYRRPPQVESSAHTTAAR